jgi:PTH1 family peptidyl-tRNA hydrolase
LKLLVGLGNPGTRYQDTRHNMGFRVVDLLANKANVAVTRYHARSLMAKFTWAGNTVLLAKPQTYMNNSGAAVGALEIDLVEHNGGSCLYAESRRCCVRV